MIRSIRMRPIQKPLITPEVIYNHQDQHLDTGSELSFLKLSEKASKQFSSDGDPFLAMETRIYNVQQRSALRLNQVQSKLMQLQSIHSKVGLDLKRELMEENKQNLRVAYRKIPVPSERNEVIQGSNFQMDENLNYVNREQSIASELNSTEKIQIISQEFYSQQNSRKKEDLPTKRPFKHRSGSVSVVRSSSQFSKTSRPKKTRNQLEQRQCNRSKSCKQRVKISTSNEKPQKKGRIYQQILSLYSIPRLLAMQPKNK